MEEMLVLAVLDRAAGSMPASVSHAGEATT
jgi:hypothetical protein